MSVEYYYMNDLNTLYNASVGDKTDGGEHHMKMMVAHDNLEAYMQKMEHWRDTALQLSRNNGEAQAKINALEADYVISNRELLVKQVEIQGLTARIAELEAENEKINYFFRRLRMFCIFAHWDNPNTEAEFYKVDAEIREYLSEYKVCIDQLTAHDAIERQDDKWIPEVQE